MNGFMKRSIFGIELGHLGWSPLNGEIRKHLTVRTISQHAIGSVLKTRTIRARAMLSPETRDCFLRFFFHSGVVGGYFSVKS